MVDEHIATQKLKEIVQRIARARALCPADPEEFAGDENAVELVSFNLLLAVQTCVDLATHLIADESWEPAATAREAFERLHERRVISQETVNALRKAIGLRNIVAHGYSGIDPMQVHTAATAGLGDLERFAAEVSVWIEGRGKNAG